MDHFITLCNSAASALMCAVLSWAVMTHRVRDGVIIKSGLILAALGYGATAIALADADLCSEAITLDRAQMLMHLGLGVVAYGYWLHLRDGRTICDIVDLRSLDR